MIKKILMVLGLFVLFLVGVIFFAFQVTEGLVSVADDFFAEVASGNLEQARTYLSEEFRAATSAEDLQLFLEKSAIQDFQTANWHNRSVENDSGELKGEVITKTGGTVPLTMKFVKEDGSWKIYAVEKARAGLAEKPAEEAPLPSRAEATDLVKQTTRDFAAAVNANDFSALHAQTADEFQEQYPLDKFAETFAVFVDKKIDLSPLENLDPLFTSDPAVTAGGELLLEGYYRSTPSRAVFSYRFIWRNKQWQLLGLNMNLKSVEKQDADQ